jgi:DNA-binding transcriptional LysR family regulator
MHGVQVLSSAMQRSPLAGIDANLLVALEALLAEQNVARAARRIGLSASATSHALARLRELLDDPLLVRTGQRMTLTLRARAIAGPLTDGLARIAAAVERETVLDPASERRTLRIAGVDFGQSVVVPELVRLLARTAPGVDVVVTPLGDGFARLGAGELDLALSAHRTVKGLRSRLLREDPFVCVVRRGHPILRETRTARRFAAHHHVLVSPVGGATGAVDDALRKRGLRRRVAVVVPTVAGAVTLAATTDLVLTCIRRSADELRELVPFEMFTPPIPLTRYRLGAYWHELQEHDPFLAWLRERVAEIAARDLSRVTTST